MRTPTHNHLSCALPRLGEKLSVLKLPNLYVNVEPERDDQHKCLINSVDFLARIAEAANCPLDKNFL